MHISRIFEIILAGHARPGDSFETEEGLKVEVLSTVQIKLSLDETSHIWFLPQKIELLSRADVS